MQIKVPELYSLTLFVSIFAGWQIYTDGSLESLIGAVLIGGLVFSFLGFMVGVIYWGKFLWDEIMERLNK